MTVFEYQNQILIVDLGLQFPDESMPGIDLLFQILNILLSIQKKRF